MTIAELIKGGQLVEIEPEKVSLVKSPANKRRFIFTKAADLEITISTDQTFDGTRISVNGEELKGVDAFNFSLVNWSEQEMEDWGATPVSASWAIRYGSEDGIDKVETYSLQSEVKKTMEKSEILKAMKDDLGIELDEAGFDKMTPEKQKALTNVAVFSKALNGQPAFRESIAFFVKSVTEAEEEVPTDPPETPTDPPDADKRFEAIEASIAAIKEKLDKKPDHSTGDDSTSEPVTKSDLEAFAGKLDAIAKAAGVKQSAETDVAKGEGGEDLWPSIKLS